MKLFAALTTGTAAIFDQAPAIAASQALPHHQLLREFAGIYTPLGIGYGQYTGATTDLSSNGAIQQAAKAAEDYFAAASIPSAGWIDDNEEPVYDPDNPMVALRQAFLTHTIALAAKSRGVAYSKYGYPGFAFHAGPWTELEEKHADVGSYVIRHSAFLCPCVYVPGPPFPDWHAGACAEVVRQCRKRAPELEVHLIIERRFLGDGEPLMSEKDVRRQVQEAMAAKPDGLIAWANVDKHEEIVEKDAEGRVVRIIAPARSVAEDMAEIRAHMRWVAEEAGAAVLEKRGAA